jgi:hypothetical protein
VAARLLANPETREAVFLISSDARGEGMFISEVACRDEKRPGHTILRASKLLAGSTWSGSGYQAYYENQEAVLKGLLKSPARVIIIDRSIPNPKPHQTLLRDTVEQHPETFKLLESAPMEREGLRQEEGIRTYRLIPT